MADIPIILDLRPLPARERHPAVTKAFEYLERGQSFELQNDHDPLPLKLYFESVYEGLFFWQPLEQGPATWRVAVTKR